MSKAKLTIEANEMQKFKQAFTLADVKVLQTVPMGDLHKVEVNYKTEQQLVQVGRYVERVNENEPITETEVKPKQKQNVKAKQK